VYMCIPESTAIAQAKEFHKRRVYGRGDHPNYVPDISDETALTEFMVINWAHFIDKPSWIAK